MSIWQGPTRYDGITGFYLGVVPSTFDIPEPGRS
jgi:hypothetical protein